MLLTFNTAANFKFLNLRLMDRQSHSLDQGPPVVVEADLQLLEDLAALLQLRSVSVREGHVVDNEALLLVDLQQGGDPVLVKFPSGAEDKHVLYPLVLKLLCITTKTDSLEMMI